MLKAWNLEDVQSAIQSVQKCKIAHVSPAEDYVTERVVINVAGSDNRVFVRGFRTDGVPVARDGKVEMVEVTTDYSDGDMPNDPLYVLAHAEVKVAVIKLGYRVVRSLDMYF